jgi:hypothetical protein
VPYDPSLLCILQVYIVLDKCAPYSFVYLQVIVIVLDKCAKLICSSSTTASVPSILLLDNRCVRPAIEIIQVKGVWIFREKTS